MDNRLSIEQGSSVSSNSPITPPCRVPADPLCPPEMPFLSAPPTRVSAISSKPSSTSRDDERSISERAQRRDGRRSTVWLTLQSLFDDLFSSGLGDGRW